MPTTINNRSRDHLLGTISFLIWIGLAVAFTWIFITGSRSGCDVTNCAWVRRSITAIIRTLFACVVVAGCGIFTDKRKVLASVTMALTIISLMMLGQFLVDG